MDIDLSDIPATGKGHRVTFDDMKGYLSKGKPKAIDYSQWGEVFYSALSPIQKISSQVLTEACATVPQVTQHHWVDITALEIARKGMREKITLLAFIIKAMVEVMAKHPSFQRAGVDNKEYVNRRYYHIGIAVDTKGGLIVPVIKDVDKKDILVLAKEIILLSEKARKGNLKQDELSGRCASISSLGGIGGGHFTPIVTPPDAYMVGVARAVYQPIYVGDAVEKRYMLPLSLSYDHRLIDGANAARFLMDLETYLVNMTNLVQDE
jgi:pyruvate dehydrogenase E2 component (dihydrolipoamide acetyltransferase)